MKVMTSKQHMRLQIYALLMDLQAGEWIEARLEFLAHMQREYLIN